MMTWTWARDFPPARLPSLPARPLKWIRRVWFVALALAIVLDVAGGIFAAREAYQYGPTLARLSLVSEIESDGSITVETMPALAGSGSIPPLSRIISIRGQPVPRGTPIWKLASLAAAREGESIPIRFELPAGEVIDRTIRASNGYLQSAARVSPIDRDARMITRMIISLLTCVSLIGCAVLLFLRRPHDPVALLFSFSFLLFAAVIDPPLLFWLATGMGDVFDLFSCFAWLLLVVGISVFPDGKFNPRPLRFVLLIAPLAAFSLTFDDLPIVAGSLIAFVAPLFLLASHVIKYRRLPPGIERQQVKWAAFGFCSGLVLLSAALFLTAYLPTSSTQTALYGLIILTLFSFGFLTIALGLLISLLRFRLWEADKVISRSAISAAVTVIVGLVWTLSVDLVKMGVEWTLGEKNETVATLAGALLAAGIFAPSQAVALRWAKTRLEGDESRVRRLISRLAVWGAAETPQEIAIRTLSALQAAIHCTRAALLVNGSRGLKLLASRDLDHAELLDDPDYKPEADRRFSMIISCEDEDGPLGTLLIGPRDDRNRYNAAQLNGLSDLAEPLAGALRAAQKRFQHAETVQLKLGSVEERLARLEEGRARLSPS
jgi:hypothetical protein